MDKTLQLTEQFENIKEMISRYRYISFDLFDTLVFRMVNVPEDIFKLVEVELKRKYRRKTNKFPTHFTVKRIKAEKSARANKITEDIHLQDIYKYMDIGLNEKEYLMELEAQTEIRCSYPNRPMIEILKWCRNEGKIIIITTDMYLPEEVIKMILRKNEICWDHLYISGEVGKTKLTGNLYDYIIDDLNIEKKDFVHIGDDAFKDVIQAGNRGLYSIHYKEKRKDISFLYKRKDFGNSVEKKVGNWLYREVQYKSVGYEIGFCALGPLLRGFCHWIKGVMQSECLDELWFLSREGYLLLKAYISIYPKDAGKVRYIHLNKNLLRMPFLKMYPSIDTFLDLAPSYSFFTIEDIFHILGIRDYKKEEYFYRKYHVEMNHHFSKEELKGKEFLGMWKEIMDLCKTRMTTQFEYFESYWNRIFYSGSRVGLVNNSLNGSVQGILEKYMDDKDMKGSLLGLQFIRSAGCRKKRINVRGWLEEIGISATDIAHFNRTTLLFEHMLFGRDGTALGFVETDREICVVTDNSEIEKNNWQIVQQIEEGVLAYCNFAKRKIISPELKSKMTLLYFEFLKNPSFHEAKYISNMYDHDISGDRRLIKKENIVFHNPIQLLKRSRKNEVAWPVGYLVLNGGSNGLVKIHNGIIWLKSYTPRLKDLPICWHSIQEKIRLIGKSFGK